VTRARPWTSYHQYGLAGDFVLFENGAWSWETTGASARYWPRLQAIGNQFGLGALSFELPHLQLAGLRMQDLASGKYPVGGDAGWEASLHAAVVGWRQAS